MPDTVSPPQESTALAGLNVDDPLWYKDAVIYQLNVKSFLDSNDDGIGDFPGLTSKLGYIRDLGVNTIWLMPFYPSPLLDDGYDISGYREVHPDYGTLADFRQFVRAAPVRQLEDHNIRLHSVEIDRRQAGGFPALTPLPFDRVRVVSEDGSGARDAHRRSSLISRIEKPPGRIGAGGRRT